MKASNILIAFYLMIIAMVMTGCHDIPEYQDDPEGNFEALWTMIDQHYCF